MTDYDLKGKEKENLKGKYSAKSFVTVTRANIYL